MNRYLKLSLVMLAALCVMSVLTAVFLHYYQLSEIGVRQSLRNELRDHEDRDGYIRRSPKRAGHVLQRIALDRNTHPPLRALAVKKLFFYEPAYETIRVPNETVRALARQKDLPNEVRYWLLNLVLSRAGKPNARQLFTVDFFRHLIPSGDEMLVRFGMLIIHRLKGDGSDKRTLYRYLQAMVSRQLSGNSPRTSYRQLNDKLKRRVNALH